MRRQGLRIVSQAKYRLDWSLNKRRLIELEFFDPCLHAKFSSWATLDRCLDGPQEPFEGDSSWTENQVGEYRGPICHSFISSPRVPGIAEDYGRDSTQKSS
jgi:hypothetical protein